MRTLAVAAGFRLPQSWLAPFVSGCFLYKNANEFETILARGEDACRQTRTPYNPVYYTMYYTIEASRTASSSLARWATLKYFGKEGMQAILGGILATKYCVYDLLSEQPGMVA